MEKIRQLKSLYKKTMGFEPDKVTELPRSGSNRRYFRIENREKNHSAIGTVGTDKKENNAFIQLANHFEKKELPTPKVIAVNNDGSIYLQEDLGDITLFGSMEKARKTKSFGVEERELLAKTIRLLPDIQFKGAVGLDFSVCYPASEFDTRSIMWDLNYFKYCFLKATGIDFQENRLEDDFQSLANVLMRSVSSTFMYRDFQSRNVMVRDGEPYFIDFQGGRKGPFYYDVASFLWQARANFTPSLREDLIKEYIGALRKYKPVDEAYFREQLRHFILFRTLQVLGAYGFRGYFEKKPHFMQSVPFALQNLRELLSGEPFAEYPYLIEVLRQVIDLKQFSDEHQKRQLTVKVMSFAYKKGIPNDTSGNGGGFVFDCRAVNNPGKYERYKQYTGLDKEVIKFLEDDGEMTVFLKHVYELVDASVKRYLERGFTNLMVAFGCTGGQHRSVYGAQHLAEHLNKKFNIKVELVHREQNIEQVLTPR